MSVRIVLAHTPAPDQRPPVHPIPNDRVVYHDVCYDGHKYGDLVIDPAEQAVSLGSEHTFRAGKGISVTHHLHPNKLNIDYRGKRVTISVPDSTTFSIIYGQLTLFSYSPPGYCLLAPIAVGAVSAVFSALCTASQSVVAVRHVRIQDLRHAAAENVIDRSHCILKSIPESERFHILRPSIAFWHKNSFYAISPLYTLLQPKMLEGRNPLRFGAGTRNVDEGATSIEGTPLQKIDYSQIRTITRDLLQALTHLHAQGVVHGHVTRQHVLLTEDNRVRLTGFGRSITTTPKASQAASGSEDPESSDNSDTMLQSFPHTPPFDTSVALRHGPYAKTIGRDAVPPGGLKKKNRPTPAADVWAAGVILYAMLNSDDVSGLHEKAARAKMLEMALHQTGDWTTLLEIDSDVPADLASLVRALLQPIAKKRLSARAALEHPALGKTDSVDDASTCIGQEDDRTSEETELSSASSMTRARFQSIVCRVTNAIGLVSALQTPSILQHSR